MRGELRVVDIGRVNVEEVTHLGYPSDDRDNVILIMEWHWDALQLVLEMNQPLGGLDILLEELSIFRSLSMAPSHGRFEQGSNGRRTDGSIYGYPNTTDSESDSTSKGRRIRGANGKIVSEREWSLRRQRSVQIPTTVVKSVERQRLKKQDGSGRNGQTPSGSYYPNNRSNYFNTFDPHTGMHLLSTYLSILYLYIYLNIF